MRMKPIRALLVALAIAPVGARGASLSAQQIASPLTSIADGQDEGFGAAVAPAQSLDVGHSREDRVRIVIDRIAREIETVTTAFATASAAERIGATRTAVAQFNRETARDGASRSFEGNGPSLSVMRQLLFVPISGAAVSSRTVMQTIGQFERSPKTDDNYYEYSDPTDLRGSAITDLPGSNGSWTTQARPPMMLGHVYALKKCRKIVVLGWYCNTALYQLRDLAVAGDGARSLITFLYPLRKGADNRAFDGARAKNTVDGYTALYVVAAADDLVLVYNLGIQSTGEAPREQSRLNDGHKLEYRQLVSRIEAALGTGKLPF